MVYINRVAEEALKRYLSAFSVVGLTGPRQSGKSTLLRHQLPDYEYISFDHAQHIDHFQTDPEGFMQLHNERVIFDEAQYVPKLFNAIKVLVDEDRKNYGKFVVTGSSQFSFVKGISESLAGRIGLMSLLPFQYTEMPDKLKKDSIFKGAYPELVSRSYTESDLWYESYLDTYLTKDVQLISNIGDLTVFRTFIRLLAANITNVLDMSSYAKELGVSVPTIQRWISVLEASYIIFQLQPYHKNMGKRLVKRPKVYFYDMGLVSFLTGVKTEELFEHGPLAGQIFENYIVSEVRKNIIHTASQTEMYYLRTQDKAEIDLILDYKTHAEFIEIKKTATSKASMIKTLKEFVNDKEQGYLVYRGKTFSYYDNITAINYEEYLIGCIGLEP
jgi:hypothetical protein